MTEAAVSFAGNLTDQPEVRHTEAGIARAMFRVAVSGRREQEPSFVTVIVWRDQAEHAAQSLAKAAGSWSWADSSSGHGPPRMAAPARPWRWRWWPRELGPSPRWATGDDDQDNEEPGPVGSSIGSCPATRQRQAGVARRPARHPGRPGPDWPVALAGGGCERRLARTQGPGVLSVCPIGEVGRGGMEQARTSRDHAVLTAS
jgi:hypothetical protein